MDKFYKRGLILWSIILLIVILFLVFHNKDERSKVCINEKCFVVEVADTPEERERGLMFRNSLKDNQGMFFIFEKEEIYPFWMKNTLIPLDIIWINQNKTIVHIENNVLPCKTLECPSYNPEKEAMYVLEINANLSNNMNIREGNVVFFTTD